MSVRCTSSKDPGDLAEAAVTLAWYDLSSNNSTDEEYLARGGQLESCSDSASDDLDCVSQDTMFSSDEPLSEFAGKQNYPGTQKFVWQKLENIPRQFGFSRHPGVNIPDMDKESSPLTIFSNFITDELLELLVQESNR